MDNDKEKIKALRSGLKDILVNHGITLDALKAQINEDYPLSKLNIAHISRIINHRNSGYTTTTILKVKTGIEKLAGIVVPYELFFVDLEAQ